MIPAEHFLVYITTETGEEAKALAAGLIEARLIACANLIPGMRSIYHWEGGVAEDSETVLIVKTHKDRLAALEAKVRELHSYDVPCIVALPMGYGHEPFLQWITAETRPPED